jgi:hypothetical protein
VTRRERGSLIKLIDLVVAEAADYQRYHRNQQKSTDQLCSKFHIFEHSGTPHYCFVDTTKKLYVSN